MQIKRGGNNWRSLLVGSVALLLVLVGFAPGAEATRGDRWGNRTDSGTSSASLAFSTTTDRANAESLDGATITSDSELAIFVAPLDTQVRKAVFYVNRRAVKVERYAPYDLRGTKRDGNAAMLSAEHLKLGENKVTVKLYGKRWQRSYLNATFTVTEPQASLPTIAEIATGNDDFSTLVAALSAATESGPVDFLGAVSDPDADLTVFAPTNDAFAQLGTAVDDALADPSGLLTEVLALHVLAGGKSGAELVAAQTVTTLGGGEITISAVDGDVFINDSKVVIADIQAANGVVHVIDAVLLPLAPGEPEPVDTSSLTIAQVASGNDDFTTLVTALTLASESGPIDFLGAISDPDAELTVFAPTNDAFAALDPATLEAVLGDPSGALTSILAYHVVGASQTSGELLQAVTVETLQGSDVVIVARDGKVFVNGSEVIVADIQTANGVIHVIDSVLIPGK